jgi:hypothetical protein
MSNILEPGLSLIRYKPTAIETKRLSLTTSREQSKVVHRELADLTERLNRLAGTSPFNIMYRVKKYDPL